MSDDPETPRFEPGDYYTAQYGSTPPVSDTPPPADAPPGTPPGGYAPTLAGSPSGGFSTPPTEVPPLTPPPGNALAHPVAPPYQPPVYPAPYPGYYPPPMMAPTPVRGTNSMAIVALIMLFVLPPLGIVFGAVARGQIKRTGEDGDGMALAGLIGGIILTSLYVIMILVFVLFFISFADTVSSSLNDGNFG
jgi:hypothetical protein